MADKRRRILVVSHCFLNDGAKIRYENREETEKERKQKREFLRKLLADDVELIQLPCPELFLYGSNRWGHVASQFDTPFFREASRKLLKSVILSLQEYQKYPQRFELLGVVGIDGSPSCGIHFTYDGDWGGDFSGNSQLEQTLASIERVKKPGIFMEVFQEELKHAGIEMKFCTMDDIGKL